MNKIEPSPFIRYKWFTSGKLKNDKDRIYDRIRVYKNDKYPNITYGRLKTALRFIIRERHDPGLNWNITYNCVDFLRNVSLRMGVLLPSGKADGGSVAFPCTLYKQLNY